MPWARDPPTAAVWTLLRLRHPCRILKETPAGVFTLMSGGSLAAIAAVGPRRPSLACRGCAWPGRLGAGWTASYLAAGSWRRPYPVPAFPRFRHTGENHRDCWVPAPAGDTAHGTRPEFGRPIVGLRQSSPRPAGHWPGLRQTAYPAAEPWRRAGIGEA